MDPTIGMLLAAAVGAFASYLAVVRRLSGKVSTSEATDLWAESRSIREWSADRITSLQAEVHDLQVRMATLEGHNEQLLTDKEKLIKKVEELTLDLERERRQGA